MSDKKWCSICGAWGTHNSGDCQNTSVPYHVYNDGIVHVEEPRVPKIINDDMSDAEYRKRIAQNNTGGSTPSLYSVPDGAKDLQDLIEFRHMNFAVGNIFKAVYRLGLKSDTSREYDLNKIIFFANREIERIKKLQSVV